MYKHSFVFLVFMIVQCGALLKCSGTTKTVETNTVPTAIATTKDWYVMVGQNNAGFASFAAINKTTDGGIGIPAIGGCTKLTDVYSLSESSPVYISCSSLVSYALSAQSATVSNSLQIGPAISADQILSIITIPNSIEVWGGKANSSLFMFDQPKLNGDGFVAIFKGSTIVDGAYIGGSGYDQVNSIAYYQQKLVIVGETNSSDFPEVGGTAIGNSGETDAFVVIYELSTETNPPKLDNVIFSGLYGGTGYDTFRSVAVDSTGIYITGSTTSPNAYRPTNGVMDVLVTHLDWAGNIVNASVLGGLEVEYGNRLVIKDDNILISGYTSSGSSFPTVSVQESCTSSSVDGFFMILAKDTLEIIHSECIGDGPNDDRAFGIAIDSTNTIYVTGSSTSTSLTVGWVTKTLCINEGFNKTCSIYCNGRCVEAFEYCYIDCPVICSNGTCASSQTECSSYCPASKPIHCPTGECVSNISSCFCVDKPGYYACFDGTCSPDSTSCITPPFQILPFPSEIEFDTQKDVNLPIAGPSGSLGSVYFSEGTVEGNNNKNLTITPVPPFFLLDLKYPTNYGIRSILSTVVDLKIGLETSSNFTKPVKLSLAYHLPDYVNTAQYKPCLAYINNNNEWECVDYNLSDANGTYSGITTHFSSFAILLTGNNDESTEESSDSDEGVSSVVYIVPVVIAVVLIMIGAAIAIIVTKRRKKEEEKDLALNTIEEHDTRA